MSNDSLTEILKDCGLFAGLREDEYPAALKYLRAHRKAFTKGEIILYIGSESVSAGLVLAGEIECSYQDESFNKFNMNHFTAGELFGEAMACSGVKASLMQVSAASDCVIMFLDFGAFFARTSYEHHAELAGNLMRILAAKNIFLTRKVRLLSTKNLRDRITAYLHTLTPNHDGVITLPFSKTALAEFLCVNRTALSRELSRMESEGLISMNGRDFVLLS